MAKKKSKQKECFAELLAKKLNHLGIVVSSSGFSDFRSPKINNKKMENFFYDDRFCSDLSDLMDVFDIDEDNDIFLTD